MGDFRDAEAMVGAFLRARLVPPVATKVPNPLPPGPQPARYVRCWVTGGQADNRAVERVQVTVTCAAANSIQASDDARAARHALLNEYTAMPLVRGVEEVSRPYFDPDPDTGGDRYSATYRLTVRAAR